MKVDTKEAEKYWKEINKENNNHYLNYKDESAFPRSEYLVQEIENLRKKFSFNKNIKICEIGCNAKRNLMFLEKNGFENLYGFDINRDALEHGFDVNAVIENKSIKRYFSTKKDFGLIFTMAVFEHIPYDSDFIFKKIASSTKFLITIEDEISDKKVIFPRNYKDVFEKYDMVQVEESRSVNISGLSKRFVTRIFKNENL